jgi:hypothetical protein
VEVRTVQTGPDWGTLRVIREGVAAGERVIVEGFQKVRPGMAVTAKPAPPELAGTPPPAHAPVPGAQTPPPAQTSGLPTAEPPPQVTPPATPAPPPAAQSER